MASLETQAITPAFIDRFLAHEGVTAKDKPAASIHLGQAEVRLQALRGLLAAAVGEIQGVVAGRRSGARPVRARARRAAKAMSTSSPATWCSITTPAGNSRAP